MSKKPLIIGIGGTLRSGSSTEKALAVSLREAERLGATTVLLGGSDISFAPYSPESTERSAAATRFIDLVRKSDGLIVGSPGYHGSVSGLVKNALDYTEDLRNDERIYLDGRAVSCIACGAGWQSIGSTLATLRSIVHALRGWPTPLGVGINTTLKCFASNGDVLDPGVEQQLKTAGRQVVEFAQAFRNSTSEVSLNSGFAA
jgi:FMN reductase